MNVTGDGDEKETEVNKEENVMNESKELFTMLNLSMFLSAKIV